MLVALPWAIVKMMKVKANFLKGGKMNKWKTHFCWTIAFGTFLLIAIITYWLGGKGGEIVSYVSFASALISIVLALVAIFYSIVQNVSSQQNIGEMRTLVSEASRIMTEKAGLLTDQADLMQQTVTQLQFLQPLAKDSDVGLALEGETFQFNPSGSSIGCLLTLYCFAKLYEFQKPVQLSNLAKLVPRLSEHDKSRSDVVLAIALYGVAMLQCLNCFLEPGSIILDEGIWGEQEIRKLPSGFKENILKTIKDRIKDPSTEPKDKDWLETKVQEINAYVEAE